MLNLERLKLIRKIFLIVVFVLLNNRIYAGGWPLPKGKSYTQFSYTYLKYAHLRNGRMSNLLDLRREVKDYTFNFYQEYGITNKLTAIYSIPLKYTSTNTDLINIENDCCLGKDTLPSGTLTGISNIRLGLKYNFINKKYLLSGEIKYLSNGLGKTFEHSTGLRTAIDAWGISPTIHISRSLKNKYFTWETGYIYHSNNFNDHFISNMELGFNLGKNKTIWVALLFNAYIPITDEPFDDQTANQTVLFNNELLFYSPGFKISKVIKKEFYLNFGFNGAIRSQRGVGSPTISFGVAYKPK